MTTLSFPHKVLSMVHALRLESPSWANENIPHSPAFVTAEPTPIQQATWILFSQCLSSLCLICCHLKPSDPWALLKEILENKPLDEESSSAYHTYKGTNPYQLFNTAYKECAQFRTQFPLDLEIIATLFPSKVLLEQQLDLSAKNTSALFNDVLPNGNSLKYGAVYVSSILPSLRTATFNEHRTFPELKAWLLAFELDLLPLQIPPATGTPAAIEEATAFNNLRFTLFKFCVISCYLNKDTTWESIQKLLPTLPDNPASLLSLEKEVLVALATQSNYPCFNITAVNIFKHPLNAGGHKFFPTSTLIAYIKHKLDSSNPLPTITRYPLQEPSPITQSTTLKVTSKFPLNTTNSSTSA